MCKLSITAPTSPTPLPKEIAVNDQSSTKLFDLDKTDNEFDENEMNDINTKTINITVDPQTLVVEHIRGGKPNYITGGMQLRSARTIYTYCGNEGQEINRATQNEIIPDNIHP